MGLFRNGLWSNSCLCCPGISSSVHRSATAARATGKHFMDTSAVQCSQVRIVMNPRHHLAETATPQPWHQSAGGTRANRSTRNSSGLCLSQQSEDQQEVSKHRTALAPALQALFIFPSNIACPPLGMHLSQLTALCLGSSKKPPRATRRLLV